MIYQSTFDADGNERSGCVTIFITIDNEGEITSLTNGGKIVGINKTGMTFVVDTTIAEQIDKFKVKNYNLVLKEGEVLDEPVKSDIELQEEELLRQLAELRAQKSEPAQ